MRRDRLGRLPTIVLALLVPVVALLTVVVTLNATSDGTGAAATGTGAGAGAGGTAIATTIGAAALLVSGWVHFYLYFRGGYRGIAPDEVVGLTVSRSFALNAIAAVVIAEALILGLRSRALLLPAAAVGMGFAVATLVA